MENLEIQRKMQKTYYLQKPEDFARIQQIVSLMPSYATKSTENYEIVDYFYETPERLMEQLDASIRMRVMPNKKTLSIICKNDGIKREFEIEMEPDDEIVTGDKYILFLEDKLQDIYTHRIDIDIVRILKTLRVFLVITTNRSQWEVINNTGYSCFVNFDKVMFKTKRHKVFDNVLEIKMNCVEDVANKTAFNRFVTDIEQRVMIVPMDETKYDAGKRIFGYEW